MGHFEETHNSPRTTSECNGDFEASLPAFRSEQFNSRTAMCFNITPILLQALQAIVSCQPASMAHISLICFRNIAKVLVHFAYVCTKGTVLVKVSGWHHQISCAKVMGHVVPGQGLPNNPIETTSHLLVRMSRVQRDSPSLLSVALLHNDHQRVSMHVFQVRISFVRPSQNIWELCLGNCTLYKYCTSLESLLFNPFLPK